MSLHFTKAAAAAAALLIAATPNTAQARGSIRYNAGDLAITTLSDLGDRADVKIDGRLAKLGWLHHEYSVFEAPFWVFDEEGYVLFARSGNDTTYEPVSYARAAALARDAGLDLPTDGTSPLSVWDRWSGAIVAGGVIVLATFSSARKRRR